MQVLVATKKTQGTRKNDFIHADEGEVVFMPLTKCDGAWADDDCGCARSLCGCRSLKGTTTVMVAELNMDRMKLYTLASVYVQDVFADRTVNVKKMALRVIDHNLKIAGQYKPGTVLEYRDDRIFERKGIQNERTVQTR